MLVLIIVLKKMSRIIKKFVVKFLKRKKALKTLFSTINMRTIETLNRNKEKQ